VRTWIALFRGINVGGSNRLPMAALRSDLEGLGLTGVRTYIQSGNVVFGSAERSRAKLADAITTRTEELHGFRPLVLLLTREELLAAVEGNPFPEATADPKSLHLSFLAEPAATPDLAALERLRAPTERFALVARVFYLHAPDGIGRSKLAATAARHLGVALTARNYRTVDKLLSMVAP
jgi:uncharacterized protein (DUF1697 family)